MLDDGGICKVGKADEMANELGDCVDVCVTRCRVAFHL